MINNELAEFLLPDFSDPLQVVFLSLILLLMTYSVISAHLAARPSEWQKKWDRGTPDDKSDDLDIEHGSVTDLWNAVATSHEKLADLMPGLLLVVGLLGTFIGLGMALNHASNILSQSDVASAAGAASSMEELMALLQGLGTKFKASTWGLCGFLILQVWRQTFRFEERRLSWVIEKVKSELEIRRQAKERVIQEQRDSLFREIGRASSAVVAGVNESLERIHDESKATSEVLGQFTSGISGLVKSMGEAGADMAGGATDVATAAGNLNGAVSEFSNQFRGVLDNVRTDLSEAIQDMSNQSAKTMREGSQKLEDATNQISNALASLSEDIKITLSEVQGSIEKSLEIQKKAFSVFDTTSRTLNEQMQVSTGTANMMKDSIERGLEGVANASRNTGSAARKMEKVAEKIDDLSAKLEKQASPSPLAFFSRSPAKE